MASKVACCDPVASSPETCVRPAGESEAKPTGMPPVRVEEIGQRVGDVLLVDVEAAAVVQREIQIDVVGVVAQRRVQV